MNTGSYSVNFFSASCIKVTTSSIKQPSALHQKKSRLIVGMIGASPSWSSLCNMRMGLSASAINKSWTFYNVYSWVTCVLWDCLQGLLKRRWLVFFWRTIVVFRDSYMSTVIFAPKYAPKTAPKNIELYLKFLSQNNSLENMGNNLSSPTIIFYPIVFRGYKGSPPLSSQHLKKTMLSIIGLSH